MSKSSQDPPWQRLAASSGPLLVSFAVLSILLVYLYSAALQKCGGHFGYPMDDTYIHMAMARSFSQHGVWGLTQYGFSSTSSSLLYTAILAVVYAVSGPGELAPFVLNILFAYLLLFLFDWVLKKAGVATLPRVMYLGLLIFGFPLAPEVMAGMEHILHAAITIVYVFFAVRLLQQEMPAKLGLLSVLGAAMVLARYEAIALIFVTGVLLFVRGRRQAALIFGFVSCLPVALFGLYSVSAGWLPVPNSIVAKASRPEKSHVFYLIHWVEQIVTAPSVGVLVIVALAFLMVLYARRRTIWTTESLTLTLFLSAALLHMQFARVGWFFRYEAYLVALGIYACALAIQAVVRLPRRRSTAGSRGLVYASFCAVAVAAFWSRGVGAMWLEPWASRNIYEQQYQMGRFLKNYGAGETVMLNDIGAAGFLSDAHIVDLYGLSTIEVARAKMHHQFTQDFRRSLAARTGTKFAILYPAVYRDVGGLPPEWVPVGSWKIQLNQICWADTVTFYAVDPTYRQQLESNLKEFGPMLPRDVTQTMPGNHSD